MSPAMSQAVNYHQWVYDAFADLLRPGTALEIGSGHGMYSRKLAAQLSRVMISDIDPEAIERIRKETADVENVEYVLMNGLDPKVVGAPVDNVILINVLEHIEADRDLLARCWDNLTDAGMVVVFSPAFQLLYSRMDREAGHFRRYGLDELEGVVADAGFEIVRSRFFNAVGFFGWVANKLMNSGIHGKGTNAQIRVYDRVIPFIRRIDRLMPFLGQSVLVVGRKR
jgi:SAM-dependent methyltransferase